jgi:hypothetical protein
LSVVDDSKTIPLSKPIVAHGETLSELVLRRPTVKELRACGQPYRVSGGGGGGASVQADYDAGAKLIAAICAIPPSSVDEMDPGDFDDACMILVGFTKPAPRAASASASASTS